MTKLYTAPDWMSNKTVDAVYTDAPKKGLEATDHNQNPVKKGEEEHQLILGRVRCLPTAFHTRE
jgi:hypothetical protein